MLSDFTYLLDRIYVFHAVDHLVNNAGITIPGLIEDCSDITKYSPIIVSYWFCFMCFEKLIRSFFEIYEQRIYYSKFLWQDVNFWGAVHGTLHAIPHLKKSKGRIIVIASTCGWFPLPRTSFYNVKLHIIFILLFNYLTNQIIYVWFVGWCQASKAALISFFETLRVELGWSIGITIVTPGFIKTELALKAYENTVSQL